MSDVLYVADMAKKLGRTEAAIRSAINRGADWLPPHFHQGRRVAWLEADVDRFLKRQARPKKKGAR
jgi:predicted DNA-binding transcriptional regulator AlpA